VTTYRILVDRAAANEIRSLPRNVRDRVRTRIRGLAEDPRPPACRKLRGYVDLYRVRIGDWRVIYRIDDASRVVTIEYAGHRSSAYQP
jgi:mRNA interferase RelE/StbE